MAELSCGGTSSCAVTSSASTRPSAAATPTRSAPSARTGASARRCASSTEISSPAMRALLHLDERAVEHQIGVGRNGAAGAALAVAELGRDVQLAAAADLHALDALVPALDDHADAEGKLDRLVAIEGAVELLLR